jgi:hypothetical protein
MNATARIVSIEGTKQRSRKTLHALAGVTDNRVMFKA